MKQKIETKIKIILGILMILVLLVGPLTNIGATYNSADKYSNNGSSFNSTESALHSTYTINSEIIYMINRGAGRYVHSTGSTANLASGTLSELGSSIQWRLTQLDDGFFTIQSISNPLLYLAAASGAGSTRIFLIELDGEVITDRYKWDLTYANEGGVLIKNVNTGKYLMYSGSTLSSRPSVDTSVVGYKAYVWLYADTDYYGNTDASEKNELPMDYKFDTCVLFSNGMVLPKLSKNFSNVIWASSEFFTFSGYDANYVAFDITNSSFIAQDFQGNYTAVITATHKLSGQTSDFTLVVNPKAVTVGIPDTGHDHQSALDIIDDIILDNGYSEVTDMFGEYMYLSVLDYLVDDSYSIFVSRSHGCIISNGNRNVATAIQLNSSMSATIYLLDSRYISLYNLTNMKLIMFIGCYTAADISDEKNLPEAAVEAGAAAALGFDSSIDCTDANNWTITLFEYLDEGYSLQSAINQMISEEEEKMVEEYGELQEGTTYITISDLVVIYGNRYQHFH